MLRKLMHAGMALSLITGASIITAQEAEARRGGRTAGIIAGSIIGLGVLGAYAAAREREAYGPAYRSCYPGRQRCEVVGQRCFYNRWGEYTCRDDVRCYRPTYCD